MKTAALVAIAMCALGSSGSAQTTWYVDVHGQPPGAGTLANPYTSIQYALYQPSTSGGDTLLVAAGTYVENLFFPPGKGVTVKSSGGPLTTVVRPAHSGMVVVLQHAGDVIEGFTITGAFGSPNDAHGVRLGAGSLARRCIVRDNQRFGIMVDVVDEGLVQECTIVRNGVGVAVVSFGRVYMANTIVWGNAFFDLGSLGFDPEFHVSYCAGMKGGIPFPGTTIGNVFADPEFWSLERPDLHLRPGSPCIDSGDPSSPLDPDGSRIDIGALTFDPAYLPEPRTYCTAKPNSCGIEPRIGFSGTSSASASSGFVVETTGAQALKFGLLLYTDSGASNAPFMGGTLCVNTAPLRRSVAVAASGGTPGQCDATLTIDMNAFAAGAIGGAPLPTLSVAGTQINGQFWGRDTPGSSLLSDALDYFVGP